MEKETKHLTIEDVEEALREWGRRLRAACAMNPEARERAKRRMLDRCRKLHPKNEENEDD